MSAVRLGDQIFNWQSIQAACGEFAATNWNAAQCVWAAVSTTIIYGAAILTTYQRVGRLATWLGNSGISIGNFKRDEISADDQDMLNGSCISVPLCCYWSWNLGSGVSYHCSWPLTIHEYRTNYTSVLSEVFGVEVSQLGGS